MLCLSIFYENQLYLNANNNKNNTLLVNDRKNINNNISKCMGWLFLSLSKFNIVSSVF